jgi:hypothetical protein
MAKDTGSNQKKPTPFQQKVITAIYPEYLRGLNTPGGNTLCFMVKDGITILSFSIIGTTDILIGGATAIEIARFEDSTEFQKQIDDLSEINKELSDLNEATMWNRLQGVVLRRKQGELVTAIKSKIGLLF